MALIEDIERRLLNWARWYAGQQSGGLGYASISLLQGGGRDGYFEAVVPTIGPEASITHQAVQALPSELRAAVESWYLHGGTAAVKARRLCIQVPTLYRRREVAHATLQRWFSDRAVRAQSLSQMPRGEFSSI